MKTLKGFGSVAPYTSIKNSIKETASAETMGKKSHDIVAGEFRRQCRDEPCCTVFIGFY
jgi:hypothetical protein